ncbi:MAG: serine/threonine-protein kinase [Polyangiaceae bacterium]
MSFGRACENSTLKMEADPSLALSPVNVGDILAKKYRVERLLGAGGMGVVVLARHIQLDQLVALKFLLTHSLDKPKIVARFEQEARAVVKLRGEHVARVLDVGTMETGAPYIVMEYLEGEDLANTLERRGALPVAEAVDYLLQTCEALAEAHGVGIVHRDLKPGNLFLTRRVDGKQWVKVLDFGISKLTGGREDLALTATTEVVGSPKYMSPEQLRASRLADARSDIWSLGVILYELLTADMPFMAETLAHLCALVISEPPRPIRSLRPEVPTGIEQIILRCLQKDPNARFQTVSDLALALDPFVSNLQTSAAQRVQAVAAESSGGFSKAPSTGNIVVGNSSHSASIGWGQTEAKPLGRSRSKIFAFVGVFVLLLVAVGTFLGIHSHAAAVGDTNSIPSASSPIAMTSSPAASNSTAATDPSANVGAPIASASASASASAVASSASSKPPASHTHKTGKKPPPTTQNADDMPNERN